MTPTTTAATTHTELRQLQESIAHQVATAFEAGGTAWQITAPLLHGLIADDLIQGPPVVATRALGRSLTRQATAVERGLAAGDRTAVEDIVGCLRAACRRLAELRPAEATDSHAALRRAAPTAGAIRGTCPSP